MKNTINSIVSILILVFLGGCAHRIPQDMQIDQFSYKRKLCVRINRKWYCKPSVLSQSTEYKAKAKHGADMDYLFSETCASEYEVEDTGRRDYWTFAPNAIDKREQANYCPWKIESYEKGGRYGFQHFVFKHQDYKLPAQMICNDSKSTIGVDICELRVGRLMEIYFPKQTIVENSVGNCPIKQLTPSDFQVTVQRAECVFNFMEVESGQEFMLTVLGYDRPVLLEL